MDKEREFAILTMVYDADQFEEIIGSERPDFKIKHKGKEQNFGVEVTEFYYSEANARLNNIPAYLGELLDERRFRHKQDKKALDVSEVTILSPDGQPIQKVMAVHQRLPEIPQYVQMIAEALHDKNQKFEDYLEGLAHVNLIIFDSEGRLLGIPAKYFYKYFFTLELKFLLLRSEFREVYFITVLEKDRWVYIPLKMLLLLSEFFAFGQILNEYFPEVSLNTVEQELTLFGEYLICQGFRDIYVCNCGHEFEVIYGNCGITLPDDGRISIKIHSDCSLPVNAELLNLGSENFFSDGLFMQKREHFFKDNTFVSEVVFDVKNKTLVS